MRVDLVEGFHDDLVELLKVVMVSAAVHLNCIRMLTCHGSMYSIWFFLEKSHEFQHTIQAVRCIGAAAALLHMFSQPPAGHEPSDSTVITCPNLPRLCGWDGVLLCVCGVTSFCGGVVQ